MQNMMGLNSSRTHNSFEYLTFHDILEGSLGKDEQRRALEYCQRPVSETRGPCVERMAFATGPLRYDARVFTLDEASSSGDNSSRDNSSGGSSNSDEEDRKNKSHEKSRSLKSVGKGKPAGESRLGTSRVQRGTDTHHQDGQMKVGKEKKRRREENVRLRPKRSPQTRQKSPSEDENLGEGWKVYRIMDYGKNTRKKCPMVYVSREGVVCYDLAMAKDIDRLEKQCMSSDVPVSRLSSALAWLKKMAVRPRSTKPQVIPPMFALLLHRTSSIVHAKKGLLES